MSQVEPSSEKYLVSESVLRENNNNNNVDSRKNSSNSAAISRKSVTTISSGSGSGIDYGVVNVAPTPPPLPATSQQQQHNNLLESSRNALMNRLNYIEKQSLLGRFAVYAPDTVSFVLRVCFG